MPNITVNYDFDDIRNLIAIDLRTRFGLRAHWKDITPVCSADQADWVAKVPSGPLGAPSREDDPMTCFPYTPNSIRTLIREDIERHFGVKPREGSVHHGMVLGSALWTVTVEDYSPLGRQLARKLLTKHRSRPLTRLRVAFRSLTTRSRNRMST